MHVRLQDLVRERLSKMFIILTIKKEWSFIFNNEERYLWFSGVIGIVKRQLSIRHRWFPIRNFDFFVCVLKDFYMTKGGGGVLKLSALTWGRRGRVRSLYRGFKLTFSRILLISGSPPPPHNYCKDPNKFESSWHVILFPFSFISSVNSFLTWSWCSLWK